MNQRTKSELRSIIANLEEIYGKEIRAASRQAKASQPLYEEHARRCAESVKAAIDLLKRNQPVAAIEILQDIVASEPGRPPAVRTQAAICASGCNHPEHQ